MCYKTKHQQIKILLSRKENKKRIHMSLKFFIIFIMVLRMRKEVYNYIVSHRFITFRAKRDPSQSSVLDTVTKLILFFNYKIHGFATFCTVKCTISIFFSLVGYCLLQLVSFTWLLFVIQFHLLKCHLMIFSKDKELHFIYKLFC